MSDVDTSAPAEIGHNAPPEPIETHEAAAEAQPLEGRELIESVASEMGWSPKDKWKGSPEEWRDATAFLKKTPSVLKSAREQMDRTNRAAAKAIEQQRTKAIEEAEARVAFAAESGNVEAAKEAARELREASKAPDPLLTDFATKNPWMGTHRKATALAIEAAQDVADTGGTVAEQIAAGEAEVRKRFPELFDAEAAEGKSLKQPPAVQGGQRTANAAPREKGWSDLPSAVRQTMTPKQLKSFGMTEAEYAKSYWAENS